MAEKKAQAVPENGAGTEAAAMEAEQQPAALDPAEELVEVNLFYDGDKYKEPVPVIVNGVKILVPRGETVKIKRKYAEVLEHSRVQERVAGQLQNRLSTEFENESKGRKIEI